ncbi:MAG: hypothetical protein ACE37K_24235 [Planctomycetota bacterium]|jgi:hypothetical protein
MRWLIAGLLFALAVTLAIGTAALRAENVGKRRELEQGYRAVWDRIVEFKRIRVEQLESVSPEKLAELHWQWLHREGARRQERLQ